MLFRSCRGQSFTLTAGGASSYSWSNGATTASLVTSSTLVANVNYTLTGTDLNGCANSTVITIKVNSCIGINETALSTLLKVYPNPSKGLITLEADRETQVVITNALGQVVRELHLNQDNNFQIILNDFASGLYTLQNEHQSLKLIIQKP